MEISVKKINKATRKLEKNQVFLGPLFTNTTVTIVRLSLHLIQKLDNKQINIRFDKNSKALIRSNEILCVWILI